MCRVGWLSPFEARLALRRHDVRFHDLTWRQAAPGSPHADTETLFLRMPPIIDLTTVFHSLEAEDQPLMGEAAFCGALQSLAGMVGGEVARAMIVRLKPYGIITPHSDEGAYAEATRRYHWVIATNPGCRMRSGNDVEHMAEGEVWFFDKAAWHMVNNGGTPRVHLIFDVWE